MVGPRSRGSGCPAVGSVQNAANWMALGSAAHSTLGIASRDDETAGMDSCCRLCFVPPRQSFLHCVSSVDPFRLLGPRFALALFEHLVHGCKNLARFSEKARDGPSKSYGVSSCAVNGSGAAWFLYRRCEISVAIGDLNSLVRAR